MSCCLQVAIQAIDNSGSSVIDCNPAKQLITHVNFFDICLLFLQTNSCYFATVLHTADEAKEEEIKEVKRLDEFGDWLDQDQEDLPDEFRLNVER